MTTTDKIMALAAGYASQLILYTRRCATEQDVVDADNALRAEIDALVRDAERYRWLRQYNTAKYPQVTEAFYLGDRNLDAAIDAAMKGTP